MLHVLIEITGENSTDKVTRVAAYVVASICLYVQRCQLLNDDVLHRLHAPYNFKKILSF